MNEDQLRAEAYDAICGPRPPPSPELLADMDRVDRLQAIADRLCEGFEQDITQSVTARVRRGDLMTPKQRDAVARILRERDHQPLIPEGGDA